MKLEKIKPLLKGAIRLVPGVSKLLRKRTGGTINSKYCYSVWLRHLTKLHTVSAKIPNTIAELGPGDSLGIGLAALLSGSNKYYALDVVKYFDTNRNLKIFEDLITLFRNRTAIPDNSEFKLIRPEIENYSFPSSIITESQLKESLSEGRLEEIRKEISNMDSSSNKYIFYQIPWYDPKIIEKNSVDFIYSQAVLEHVEDLENSYSAMNKWLKPLGYMSHSIDFKSHGLSKSWNGHWTFNDIEWNIIKGDRVYLLNRQPFSYHIDLHKKYGFAIMDKVLSKAKNELKHKEIANRFKSFNEEELTTSGMYILSKKE